MPTDRPKLADNIFSAKAALDACASLAEPLNRAADMLIQALNTGHKLLTCGNGGSAADAMHLATEFVCRYDKDRRPYPAICFSTNGPDITAIGNDYSFEQAFERQTLAFAKPGDVLVTFSTSGKSKNVLLALQAANKVGAKSIAFLGKGGGVTKGIATIDLIVPDCLVTARIQEAQKLLLHTLCEIVETEIAKA